MEKTEIIEQLDQAIKMIHKWIPEAFPTDKEGRIHFARAVMESTADVMKLAIEELQK